MISPDEFLASRENAEMLGRTYGVPTIDVLLVGLNSEGVNCPIVSSDRVRFSLNILTEKKPFYVALTNNKASRWAYDGGVLSFKGEVIGHGSNAEKDTCDNTYFRRFIGQGPKSGTELTLNSNSRSNCAGCKFCGTYTQESEDIDDKDLTTPHKLRKKLNSIIEEKGLEDFSHLVEVGVVTGCFPNERRTLDHLRMINDVLRHEYAFKGEIKYVGSQILGENAIEELARETSPAGISLTVECFTRRDMMLKPSKNISLDRGREVLKQAKDAGIKTTILYIAGLDPLDVFEREINKYVGLLTKFPVINTLQEYESGQAKHRHPEAENLEYFLKARNIVEKAYLPTALKPNVWENYRGLFFTRYGGETLESI